MRVRPLVRQAHLYTGLGLSLLLLVLALTGTALVFKAPYWRLVYPELRAPAPHLTARDHAAAVAAAAARFGDAVRSVKLPARGVPAYHLYLEDGEAFLSAGDHHVIDTWRPGDRPMSLLFDLHAHLMAGETGERVGGVVGLFGALLTITGLVLWWPARRRFSAAHLLPRSLGRRALILLHRDLGALVSPVLLVLLLTGSGMVFHGTARALLNGLFGDQVPADSPALATPGGATAPRVGTAAFMRAAETFPDARIVFYYPPGAGSTGPGFRLRRPCELHPNGRSYVYLDARGRVERSVDACAAAPGERATHALYPLHSGLVGGRLYAAVVFLGGLALTMVSASGAIAYLRQLAGRDRRVSEHPARPARGRPTPG